MAHSGTRKGAGAVFAATILALAGAGCRVETPLPMGDAEFGSAHRPIYVWLEANPAQRVVVEPSPAPGDYGRGQRPSKDPASAGTEEGAGREEAAALPYIVRFHPDPAIVHWEQDPGRLVWIVTGKDARHQWDFRWKGPKTGSGVDYFPGDHRIPTGSADAYYSGRPDPEAAQAQAEARGWTAAAGSERPPRDGTWVYEILVHEVPADGSPPILVAHADPEVVLRDP